MEINNCYIYTADGRLHPGSLGTEGERISGLRTAAEAVPFSGLPAQADILLPGLIDLHFHGAMGKDVCDGSREAIDAIASYELRHGVTSICPATLTLPEEQLCRVLRIMAEYRREKKAGRAELIGINMEGPFISPVKKGAQNENYIRNTDLSLLKRFLAAGEGLVKIVGLAPEENPEYLPYLEEARKLVRVSLAHTNADYDTACTALRNGASHAVHLYNAMTGAGHREPGVVAAVFEKLEGYAELITDGIHVHPAMVRLAFRELTEKRAVIISDSLRATGMPDGEYELGGQTVVKQGELCRLKEGGNIAGSVSNLYDCVKTAVLRMGIPFESAIRAVTKNPADCLAVSDRLGSIAPGKQADLLLIRPDFTLKRLWKRGKNIDVS